MATPDNREHPYPKPRERTEQPKHPRPYAKVYFTNMGFHDYTNAEKWGEFVPLTQGRVNLKNTDRLEAEIQSVLCEMTENDYLLLSGAPVVIAMVTGYIFRKFGYVDCIFWDALYGDYRYRKLTFEDRNVAANMRKSAGQGS